MLKKNAYERQIPSLGECIQSQQLQTLLFEQFVRIFPAGRDGDTQKLVQRLFQTVAAGANDQEAANSAQEFLGEAGVLKHLRAGLAQRSELIFEQIRPHIKGTRVLDFGCGDGEVGRRLNEIGLHVSSCDVIDYRTQAAKQLPWQLIREDEPEVGLTDAVDSILLLTVLHHSEDPDLTFKCVKKLRPSRIITIESVYDLTEDDVLRGEQAETCSTSDAHSWLGLSHEQQFCYACFWDWFYNKVVNSGVVVPYNFSSPDEWQCRLRIIGYNEVKRIYLGIDQPLVPEFHVLQIFDR